MPPPPLDIVVVVRVEDDGVEVVDEVVEVVEVDVDVVEDDVVVDIRGLTTMVFVREFATAFNESATMTLY